MGRGLCVVISIIRLRSLFTSCRRARGRLTSQPVLGRKTATELQILRLGLHVNVVSTQDIVDKYQTCFEGFSS